MSNQGTEGCAAASFPTAPPAAAAPMSQGRGSTHATAAWGRKRARRRWIVNDSDDKRHRRSCWSCGGRFGQGWELHRQKDPYGPGLVVCDGCIEAWVSDVDDPRTVTWDGGKTPASGDTEAEALVAALEAAP